MSLESVLRSLSKRSNIYSKKSTKTNNCKTLWHLSHDPLSPPFPILITMEALLLVSATKNTELLPPPLPCFQFRATISPQELHYFSIFHIFPTSSSMLQQHYSREVQLRSLKYTSSNHLTLIGWKLYHRLGRQRILGPNYPHPSLFI